MHVEHLIFADKGVENFLDQAILDGRLEQTFGCLIGRLAKGLKAPNDGISCETLARFYVSHIFPVDTRNGFDSATTIASFFERIQSSLVGGLRIVGFYSLNLGGAVDPNLDVERLARSFCQERPAVLLEKSTESHSVKARIFNLPSAVNRPADVKYFPLLNDGVFKRFTCNLDLNLEVLLTDGTMSTAIGIIADAVRTAVGVSRDNIPLEAYQTAGSLPSNVSSQWGDGSLRPASAAALTIFLTKPLPLSQSDGTASSHALKSMSVDGILTSYAIVCDLEPAASTLSAIAEDVVRSLESKQRAYQNEEGAKYVPLRYILEQPSSDNLNTATRGKPKTHLPSLPLFSVYRQSTEPELENVLRETSGLGHLGVSTFGNRVERERIERGTVSRGTFVRFLTSQKIKSMESDESEVQGTLGSNEQKINDIHEVDCDEEDYGIELVEDGQEEINLSAQNIEKVDKEGELQNSKHDQVEERDDINSAKNIPSHTQIPTEIRKRTTNHNKHDDKKLSDSQETTKEMQQVNNEGSLKIFLLLGTVLLVLGAASMFF